MRAAQFKFSLIWFSLFIFLPLCIMGQDTGGVETRIMVRVHSKDAKFIGSSIGGAHITIKKESTGELLAEGITTGSTGDTKVIMEEPRTRGKQLSTEETAGFEAVLNITEPIFVTVEATAPVNKKQASVKSSTQLWIIPGKDILGDGIVLEVPGFIIDILSPQTHERIEAGLNIQITANVVMMCGCPVTPGGIWNADDYEISAIIGKEGEENKTIQLKAEEKPSTFSGNTVLTSGNYEITVYAFDPRTGNTGVDRTNFIVL